LSKKLLLVCFSFLLSACGAKGDLFIPTEPSEQQETERKGPESEQNSTKNSAQKFPEQPQL